MRDSACCRNPEKLRVPLHQRMIEGGKALRVRAHCRMKGTIPIMLLGGILAGCSHPPQKVSTAPPSQRVGSPQTLLMSGEFHEATTKAWRVKVSADKLEVQSMDPAGQGSVTTSSQWNAGPGWVAYIENDQRVWAYDGDRLLLLVEVERVDSNHSKLTKSGPTRFSVSVPPQVVGRLSDTARNAIKYRD